MVRRVVTIGAVAAGLPIWLLLAPLWVPGSLLVDALGRLWRFPTLRLCCFLVVYLVHEWIGVAAAGWLWVTGSLGRSLDLDAHRRVQGWWASSLLQWAGHLLRVRLDVEDHRDLPAETFIMLSRHASMVDAVIPAAVVAGRADRFVHYVIKRELRWVPALDLFGTRLGNHFVTRGQQDTGREEEAIAQLARSARPGSGLVIFPEGTYATPQSRERVLRSLRRNGDHHVVTRAEALRTLLPPKPAGTLALLRGQPTAHVVVVGHVGLGGVAQLRGLRRRLPLDQPVVVRWWVHHRTELPPHDDELERWLAERWQQLDHWVTGARGDGHG